LISITKRAIKGKDKLGRVEKMTLETLAAWLHNQFCRDWAGDSCELDWSEHKPVDRRYWRESARTAKIELENGWKK